MCYEKWGYSKMKRLRKGYAKEKCWQALHQFSLHELSSGIDSRLNNSRSLTEFYMED